MWNHNFHFHNYLLRQCPTNIHRALDIGCGLGNFAQRLADRAEIVDAIDIDSRILNEASNLNPPFNVRYFHIDFLKADLPEASYDVITAIASLHHMDLEAALTKMKALLHSSGTLVILGLYREVTITDYIYSAISVPLNLAYLIWHRASLATPAVVAQTCSADLSLNQIKTIANSILPGFRLRRHLFWRYSLIWHKPEYYLSNDEEVSQFQN
ncbi:MAG: class I SAM-dependent methyltransferase [Cyanobacteria bacterium P01_G01_bin.49]